MHSLIFEQPAQALHLQRDQLFIYDDRPTHVRFAQWYMRQSTRNVDFPVYVLFLDEATFKKMGWRIEFVQCSFEVWKKNPML
ncbi:hypothetical protein CEXT_240661 [Caerostris extrusa]|uniref:Uncharacterized protein n=1 Tax=Caerostris extrusa TaxID=172846 RepID=A0AAV4P7X8_CAEEX|nr:hypothetical protein CEXT_240661 [Caerostris extrusa]